MRLPNGTGSVYKLKGNRRNPWCARKTVGYNDKGYPIYKYIGYYHTRSEALNALFEKQTEKPSGIPTVKEMFESYDERILSNRKESYRRQVILNYNRHVAVIENYRVDELNLDFLQQFISSLTTASVQQHVMNVISGILKESVMRGFLPAGSEKVLSYVQKQSYKPSDRKPFTPEEINLLWQNTDIFAAKVALFLLYTGMRVNECLALESITDERFVSIEESKTKAGVRIVPLHHRIMPFANEVIACQMSYHKFNRLWALLMNKLDMKHSIHECRHTFISRMVEIGADARIIKTIVGHAGGSITDDIYTHIRKEVLLETVEQLP